MIELLVAIVVSSFLILAVYATFSQGVGIWRRAMTSFPKSEVDIAVEKMKQDLRNAYPYRPDMMSGGPTWMQFYALRLQDQPPGASDPIGEPIRIHYHWDSIQGDLVRTEEGYERLLYQNTTLKPSVKKVLADVRRFKIYYQHRGGENRSGQWLQEWKGKCLPSALRIEIERGRGKSKDVYARKMDLPLERCLD